MNPYENINYWQNLQQQQAQPQQTNSQIILQRLPVSQATPVTQQTHQVQTILTASGQQFHQLTPAATAQPETATNLSTPHFLTFVHSATSTPTHSTHYTQNFTASLHTIKQENKNVTTVVEVSTPAEDSPPNIKPKPLPPQPQQQQQQQIVTTTTTSTQVVNTKASPKTPKIPKDQLPAPKIPKPNLSLKRIPQADKHKMGPPCDHHSCPGTYNCSKFFEDTRRSIFNDFWNTLNSDQRHIFVANLVFAKPIDRRVSEEFNEENRPLSYLLRNSNGINEEVCQVMFLNTLDITQKQVNLWMKKYQIGGDGLSKAKMNYQEQLQPVIRFVEDPSKPKKRRSKKKQEPTDDIDHPQIYYHTPAEEINNSQNLAHATPIYIPHKIDRPDNNLTTAGKERKRRAADYFDPNCPNKPKRSKAIVQPELWKINIKKTLRLEGKAYITQTKTGEYIQIRGKELGPTCTSNFCNKLVSRQCHTFTPQLREKIFQDIWQRMDWEQRKVFAASMISRRNIKRRRSNLLESRRQETLIYHLPNEDGIPVQICQKMFCSTTGLSKIQTLRWTKQYSIGSQVDQAIMATKDSTYHANEWLDTLPRIIIDGKTFVEPHFISYSDCYHTYEKSYKGQNLKLLERHYFKNIMKSKHLHIIGEPIDDKCQICEKESKQIEEPFKRHTTTVENSEAERNKDIRLVESDKAVLLFVHLQPVKVIPMLKDNPEQLYKSKLLCYNVTIHDVGKKFYYCYTFSEDQIGENVTSSVIASILIKHLKEQHLKNLYNEKFLPIILYSNGTKNMRNITMSNALLNLTSMYKNLKIIQKFSEINHSLVEECIHINKIIDRHINTTSRELYLPSQLAKCIREIKRNHKDFTATHMDFEEFSNYSDEMLFTYSNLMPGSDGLDEQDIRSLKYESSKIYYKFDYTDEWMELIYGRTCKTDYKKPIMDYPQLFESLHMIKKSKWDDLQDLKKYIPYDCQQFYNSLKYYED